MSNIFEEHFSITRSMRNKRNNHSSFVLWFTGLSGSGKSTIANKLEETLYENHFQTYTLDGDNIRGGINKGLSFTAEDRQENLRRIGEIAKIFVDAGVLTIASFVSPLEIDRKLVRDIIGKDDFIVNFLVLLSITLNYILFIKIRFYFNFIILKIDQFHLKHKHFDPLFPNVDFQYV